MTTVTFRNGIIAYDSLVSRSDISVGSVNKGCKSKSRKYITACTGSIANCKEYLDWVKNDMKGEKPFIDKAGYMEALLYDRVKHKIYYVDYHLRLYSIKAKFHAIGSGFALALGAMDQGASAVQVIRTAIKFDEGTGGSVKALC